MSSPISTEGKAFQAIENAAFQRDAVWVSTLLDQIQARRFHGKLVLICEKGLVVRVIQEQSLMPPHRGE